jgi:FlaA1/EpsC-like NDP-sugar epimerase
MYFDDKTILITGGTGSLGKVLTRRVLAGELGKPKKVIILSRDEAKQHSMRLEYLHKKISTDEVIYNNFQRALEFRIGDVRDYASVCGAIKDADVVINAAALKQVPHCEYFPEQAVLTNCMGAANIVRAITEHDYTVDTVVGVSTDKAAKPVNVMGMTKAVQERIFTSANVLNQKTRFICVRYGNVLASRGSVIPMFYDQISHGGPLTVTHKNMTRFLLSLHDAVDTIFAALQHADPGETFIPRAPSATIYHVAKALIGDRKLAINEIGVRPGEKMHEVLISEEEWHHTKSKGNYYAISSMLPELRSSDVSSDLALNAEYSSADNVLSLDATKELLSKHNLLNVDAIPTEEQELLV